MKLKDYKEKKMQDPEFAKAYEEIQTNTEYRTKQGIACKTQCLGVKQGPA